MSTSLARVACTALKNMVLRPTLLPCGGAAGAGCGAESGAAAAGMSGVPQLKQNFWPDGTAVPHEGQATMPPLGAAATEATPGAETRGRGDGPRPACACAAEGRTAGWLPLRFGPPSVSGD
jgi:hypothetical protein